MTYNELKKFIDNLHANDRKAEIRLVSSNSPRNAEFTLTGKFDNKNSNQPILELSRVDPLTKDEMRRKPKPTLDSYRKEGYFWSKQEPNLPKPVHADKAFRGKTKVLKALTDLEKNLHGRMFKGIARCRICKENLGSKEFSHNDFIWPEGLKHYIKEHNYRPSDDFIEEVLGIKQPARLKPLSDAIKGFKDKSKSDDKLEKAFVWFYEGSDVFYIGELKNIKNVLKSKKNDNFEDGECQPYPKMESLYPGWKEQVGLNSLDKVNDILNKGKVAKGLVDDNDKLIVKGV